jgi:hypothetical protein
MERQALFSKWKTRWLFVLVLLQVGLFFVYWVSSSEVTVALEAGSTQRLSNGAALDHTQTITTYIYLPLTVKTDVCRVSTGETFGELDIPNWTPSPPAETHPDLNLAVRGYTPTQAFLGLVDLGGDTDPGAPQLAGAFVPSRAPSITADYQVYGWDWDCNCRIGPISPPDDPEVTLIDLAATAGELVHVPDRSDGDIGEGYQVLVLYASPDRITLKYTSEDSVVSGYTLHVENVCVDAALVALYQQLNDAGRHMLPALKAGQAFGRAQAERVGVAIRDNGTFLDPRSRKDWWRGY